jgi:hypothetical protein
VCQDCFFANKYHTGNLKMRNSRDRQAAGLKETPAPLIGIESTRPCSAAVQRIYAGAPHALDVI